MAWMQRGFPLPRNGEEALRDRSIEAAPARRWRWDRALVWYMRLMALMWIAKGVGFWALILGVGYPIPMFEARTTGAQATVIYFAVIDLVAAVGLWLTSVWGGVMWLLAIMSHLILGFFFPTVVPSNVVSIGLSMVLILVYLLVSWLAARDEAIQSARS
jgi:fatty acid desaturase